MRRAISWREKADLARLHGGIDAEFIFLWISFNVLYGTPRYLSAGKGDEVSDFRHFVPIYLIVAAFLLIPSTSVLLTFEASVSWVGYGMFVLGAVLLCYGIILYREARHCEGQLRLVWFARDILRAQKDGRLEIEQDLGSLKIDRWRIGVTPGGSLYLAS